MRIIDTLRPAFVLLVALALLTGIAFPLTMTGLAQVILPDQANGSLIREQGRVVGSALIGQSFTTPRYFNGRPSAAGKGYDAGSSAASNLAPTAAALVARVDADVSRIRASGVTTPTVPADLVTTSASGLDPDLSPEAAFIQVPRVATARGLSADGVRALVTRSIDHPLLGVVGEPRVNVLLLNRQLDRLSATRVP
ncbi:potassium-transporting ATPase subunit KdpC [Sphingomonas oligophenolica]|uniref:Potassium-transporting ATPase KdpC subunit n=1 Tax=Sphingomonas oligophenolica TaxID=301154 RepID=A0A502CB02_9SPHN|nr:potassium-transporting ATPase subunit KdpC [Sphingomonas oligophenolica]TPG10033.1 potassium-transporting ATPase subunit KdpC [Sphingomonas oligophenolica]